MTEISQEHWRFNRNLASLYNEIHFHKGLVSLVHIYIFFNSLMKSHPAAAVFMSNVGISSKLSGRCCCFLLRIAGWLALVVACRPKWCSCIVVSSSAKIQKNKKQLLQLPVVSREEAESLPHVFNCVISLNCLNNRLSVFLNDRSGITLISCSYWPDAEAFRQGETEDKSSQDTQHRSSPADEESCSQFKPIWQGLR